MQYRYLFVLLVTMTIVEKIVSSNFIADDGNEGGFDSSSAAFPKPTSVPDCIFKNQLQTMLNRDRRASISRPYFHHWRPARDSTRYAAKTSLAFSPRLGKRSYEDDNDNKFAYRSVDLDTFLVALVGYLQGKQIDIVYEDPTKICLSQPVSDSLIQPVLDKFDTSRRDQEMQDKEEARSRQPAPKHPVLFRYRLG